MSFDAEFDDIVKICEFYSDEDHPLEVDEYFQEHLPGWGERS